MTIFRDMFFKHTSEDAIFCNFDIEKMIFENAWMFSVAKP
jgi:hypothetical protein